MQLERAPNLSLTLMTPSHSSEAAAGIPASFQGLGHEGLRILAEMRERNIPVVVGADAHEPGRVAANFEDALELLKKVGYSHTHIVLNRQRHPVEIDTALRSLKPV